jgi:hypothetical protein
MSNELQVYSVDFTPNRYNSGRTLCTPFRDSSVFETIQKYDIKLPFEVVDMSMGLSKCPSCGAVYAGNQRVCSLPVPHHKDERLSWYDIKGNHPQGGPTFLKECDTYVRWDLESEFYKQKSFFDFVERVRHAMTFNDEFEEQEHNLPAHLREYVKVNELRAKVSNLEAQVASLNNAMREVIDRMSSAGHSLAFGG